ncbi:MAG: hypothetical protein KJ888_21000 [Gammaproteobacteria bacterium]|nr:hypothetical protein [Gammaproteobacteria bacterium]
MTSRLNYGPYYLPNPCSKFPAEQPLYASVAFKALGGKFVTRDSSTNNFKLSVATDTQIWGWAEVDGDMTGYATAAYDFINIIDDLNAIFEMPNDAGNTALTAAILKTLIGETCDIKVTNGIQGCDYDASSYDVVKIVGGSVDRNSLYVKINPIKFYTLGYSA